MSGVLALGRAGSVAAVLCAGVLGLLALRPRPLAARPSERALAARPAGVRAPAASRSGRVSCPSRSLAAGAAGRRSAHGSLPWVGGDRRLVRRRLARRARRGSASCVQCAGALAIVVASASLGSGRISPHMFSPWPAWRSRSSGRANLFNFMDGSDGLAALMAIIGFGAFGVGAPSRRDERGVRFALAVGDAAVPRSSTGRPRAMFMGDVGAVAARLPRRGVRPRRRARASSWPRGFRCSCSCRSSPTPR